VKHWDNGPGKLPPNFELLQAMHCRRRRKASLCCKIGATKIRVINAGFRRYSSFGIGVDRMHSAKWHFHQENATF
jgi:hypothetical protein